MTASVSIQTAAANLDLHTLGVAAGYLGAALGVVMVIPQIVRTYRNRARPGVSALSWALTALSCFTWLLYGIRASVAPQIPGNVLLVSGAVVVALAVPASLGPRWRAAGLAGAALVLVLVASVVPPTAVGFVAFGIGIVSTLPQTLRSVFAPRAAVSAVSVPTWLLYAASQVCWLIFALLVHDLVVLISAVFILTSSLVVVVSERRRARRRGAIAASRPDPATAICAAPAQPASAPRRSVSDRTVSTDTIATRRA